MSNNIDRDLPIATRNEDNMIRILRIRKYEAGRTVPSETYDKKDYDIWARIKELYYTIECKYDLGSYLTGNIAIERECYGSPSGIYATKATHWMSRHYIQDEKRWRVINIPIKILKEAVWKLNQQNPVTGGDDKKSDMYLIPIVRFEELGIKKSFYLNIKDEELDPLGEEEKNQIYRLANKLKMTLTSYL